VKYNSVYLILKKLNLFGMNISKFNLYNAEWLDLVFDHRNKAYGAYELRQHYSRTMSKAMGLTFAGLAVLIAASVIFKPKPANTVYIGPEFRILPPVSKIIDPEIKKPEVIKHVEPAEVSATGFVIPVIVPSEPVEQPPVIADIKDAIGPQDVKGPAGGDNVIKPETGTGGGGDAVKIDEHIYDAGGEGLEAMPEPVGGATSWSKFLQKNLRYPAVAQEQGISGRVFLSFVIEKDGHLSNIVVERGAGYGFDEEATRVLKLAKAWKPGIQNGGPVRVKYVIPMNFQLADN
jgi:protein TonB